MLKTGKYKNPLTSLLLILLISFFFNNCYVLQQAGPFLKHRLSARAIDKMLTDPDTDAETRRFLLQVKDIKQFATDILSLKEDKNYSAYMQVEDKSVATVVSACPPFSFEQWLWNYPIVGKMPYRGFYNEKAAVKESDKLKKKGLDVWIRKVRAFSSLGYFRDPLFSYMKYYSPYDLANLLIHEQTHATLFFKGKVQFNEELATFIGDTGGRLYVLARYGDDSEEYLQIDKKKHDSEIFREIIYDLRTSLETLYSHPELDPDTMQIRKQEIITAAKEKFIADYDSLFYTENYRPFYDLAVNNAYLSQFSMYYQDLDLYRRVYEQAGSSIPRMLKRLMLLEKKENPKAVMESWVSEN